MLLEEDEMTPSSQSLVSSQLNFQSFASLLNHEDSITIVLWHKHKTRHTKDILINTQQSRTLV